LLPQAFFLLIKFLTFLDQLIAYMAGSRMASPGAERVFIDLLRELAVDSLRPELVLVLHLWLKLADFALFSLEEIVSALHDILAEVVNGLVGDYRHIWINRWLECVALLAIYFLAKGLLFLAPLLSIRV
jgi:hypothetical protein